jgi:dinuclear metal center YbgI/SA1388 family protein
VKWLDSTLRVGDISDSSINGLQVEGAERIEKIAVGVDASIQLYTEAIAQHCSMVIVHHGLIWGGIKRVCGIEKKHLKLLLEHDLNLYAAHLPLDLHPRYGNNAGLCRILHLKNSEPFGIYNTTTIGFTGTLPVPMSTRQIAGQLQRSLGGPVSTLPFGTEMNSTVAVISGGGSDCLREAVDKKIDCFVTGEPEHKDHHYAREGAINVVYCSHYHSEKIGVQLLAEQCSKEFDVETVFIDIPTIV